MLNAARKKKREREREREREKKRDRQRKREREGGSNALFIAAGTPAMQERGEETHQICTPKRAGKHHPGFLGHSKTQEMRG